MFKLVYLIDVVQLPEKWKRFFYDRVRDEGRGNGSLMNLYWQEIDEEYPDELEFKVLLMNAGIPYDTDREVYLKVWW